MLLSCKWCLSKGDNSYLTKLQTMFLSKGGSSYFTKYGVFYQEEVDAFNIPGSATKNHSPQGNFIIHTENFRTHPSVQGDRRQIYN